MNLIVLPEPEWKALRHKLDAYIPEEEATKAFWALIASAENTLKQHLLRFGAESEAWEVPWHSQRCRVIYSYLYAEAVYTPELLAGIAAAIPSDGQSWGAEMECFTDARRAPNGGPFYLGVLALHEGNLYANAPDTELIAYAAKLGVQRQP